MSYPEQEDKTKNRGCLKFLGWLALIVLLILLAFSAYLYIFLLSPNVSLGSKSSEAICIPTGSDYKKVREILVKNHILIHSSRFDRTAGWKNYTDHVRPGRFRIMNGMSNNELLNLLRSCRQEPVRLTLISLRTTSELAGKVSHVIEADSSRLVSLLNDTAFLRNFGLDPANAFALTIPNTYEFLWNTSAEQFLKRMDRERKRFWNPGRRDKCSEEGLTIPQVVTLASIVEKETAKDDEKSMIAGVYMNRLRKGMLLQADPTLIYAWNDYTIKRVLDRHKEIKSPYNTYIHEGLPPGPICLPSVSSIDAVLNYSHIDFLYFCAKEDLSGYHNFARTLAEHNRNAARYQAALKKLNIR